MVDSSDGAGSSLYLVIGGLIVAVLAIGFVAFGSRLDGSDHRFDVVIEAPKIPLPARY